MSRDARSTIYTPCCFRATGAQPHIPHHDDMLRPTARTTMICFGLRRGQARRPEQSETRTAELGSPSENKMSQEHNLAPRRSVSFRRLSRTSCASSGVVAAKSARSPPPVPPFPASSAWQACVPSGGGSRSALPESRGTIHQFADGLPRPPAFFVATRSRSRPDRRPYRRARRTRRR